MRGKNTYVILIIILVIFGLLMFLIYGKGLFKKTHDTTILVGDNTIWTYQDKKWHNITDINSINNFNWDKYNVYLNHNKFGEYYLWHDDKWYAFDESKKAVNMEGELLAYKKSNGIDVIDFSEDDVTNTNVVKNILKDNNIDINSEFTTEYMVNVDFDSDGVDEEFYVISNVFPIGFSSDTTFSIVFMLKGDKVYYLYKSVDDTRNFNGCKPYINSILDVDDDKIYEFIISCGRYSVDKRIDMLYQYSDEGFKILISNQ